MAYALYLKGKLQLDVILNRLVTARDFDRIEKLAAQAIQIDPGFAKAPVSAGFGRTPTVSVRPRTDIGMKSGKSAEAHLSRAV